MTIPSPQEINQWKEDAEMMKGKILLTPNDFDDYTSKAEIVERLKKELEETEESIKEHELKLKEVSVGFKEYAYNEIKREYEKAVLRDRNILGEEK